MPLIYEMRVTIMSSYLSVHYKWFVQMSKYISFFIFNTNGRSESNPFELNPFELKSMRLIVASINTSVKILRSLHWYYDELKPEVCGSC